MTVDRHGSGIAPTTAMGQDVARAWSRSFFTTVSAGAISALSTNSIITEYEPGEFMLSGTTSLDSVAPMLIVRGLSRTRLTQISGRTVTVRYARPGAVVGLVPFLIGLSSWRSLGGGSRDVEALSDTVVLHLNEDRVRSALVRYPDLMMLCARNLGEQLVVTQQRLADELFQPVRWRLAAHLLTLGDRSGSVIVVRAQHEAIAGALGSVREVVSRELKRLEREGILRRVDGVNRYIEIVQPDVLRRIAAGED